MRLVKAGNIKADEILNTEKVNRSEVANFFLKMYLKTNVPFFANFEGDVL